MFVQFIKSLKVEVYRFLKTILTFLKSIPDYQFKEYINRIFLSLFDEEPMDFHQNKTYCQQWQI